MLAIHGISEMAPDFKHFKNCNFLSCGFAGFQLIQVCQLFQVLGHPNIIEIIEIGRVIHEEIKCPCVGVSLWIFLTSSNQKKDTRARI